MKQRTVTFFNLGVLLTLIFGLNWNTEPSYDQLIQGDDLESRGSVEYNRGAGLELDGDENTIESLGIELHPGNEYMPGSNGSPRSLRHCKSLAYRTLKSLPQEPVEKLEHLTLYFSDTGRRGLGGGSTVILRCQNVEDEELVGVLVHEIGHIMDTGVMGGNRVSGVSEFKDGSKYVRRNDPSLDFYRINWKNEDTMRAGADSLDFVSGYAMTDPFEDFAESYAYYILHGTEFRRLARVNSSIKQKYDYLKTTVFEGKEYFNGDPGLKRMNYSMRNYDVTVLPYNIDRFFVI